MGKEGGAHCKITCSVKAKQPPLEHNLLSGVMSMKCDRRSESRKGQFALPFNKRSVSNGILACCHPTRGQEKVRHREKSQACTRPSPTLPNTGHPHKLSIGNPHFFSPSLHFIAPFYLRRNKTPRVTGHGWGRSQARVVKGQVIMGQAQVTCGSIARHLLPTTQLQSGGTHKARELIRARKASYEHNKRET